MKHGVNVPPSGERCAHSLHAQKKEEEEEIAEIRP